MTTVATIIRDAFRQSNLLSIKAVPTDDEQAEALRYLSRIVKSVFGFEAGDLLEPVPIGNKNIQSPAGYPWYTTQPPNDWFVPKDKQLMCNVTSIVNLNLTPLPDDGTRVGVTDIAGNFATYPVTLTGNGRTIEGATSVLLNTNNTNKVWFYRQDLANWALIFPLDDVILTFPFPEEYDDFFITMLAMRLNPAYGRQLDPQSQEVMRRSKSQFRARYHQTIQVGSELGLTQMSLMARDRDQWSGNWGYFDEQAAFNFGGPFYG